jgi:hypothetical protein
MTTPINLTQLRAAIEIPDDWKTRTDNLFVAAGLSDGWHYFCDSLCREPWLTQRQQQHTTP